MSAVSCGRITAHRSWAITVVAGLIFTGGIVAFATLERSITQTIYTMTARNQ